MLGAVQSRDSENEMKNGIKGSALKNSLYLTHWRHRQRSVFMTRTAPNHDFRADKMGNDFGLLYFRVWWWW